MGHSLAVYVKNFEKCSTNARKGKNLLNMADEREVIGRQNQNKQRSWCWRWYECSDFVNRENIMIMALNGFRGRFPREFQVIFQVRSVCVRTRKAPFEWEKKAACLKFSLFLKLPQLNPFSLASLSFAYPLLRFLKWYKVATLSVESRRQN